MLELFNQTRSSSQQAPDYRLYKSEPELTTVKEEVDEANGEDKDKMETSIESKDVIASKGCIAIIKRRFYVFKNTCVHVITSFHLLTLSNTNIHSNKTQFQLNCVSSSVLSQPECECVYICIHLSMRVCMWLYTHTHIYIQFCSQLVKNCGNLEGMSCNKFSFDKQ